MNLINTSSSFSQNISLFSNWVDSTPVSQVIDTVTYDLYESNNPFRRKFRKEDISNKGLRYAANTSAAVGAEFFSVFTNPYYLSHKVTKIPVLYKSVVEIYKKNVSDSKIAE